MVPRGTMRPSIPNAYTTSPQHANMSRCSTQLVVQLKSTTCCRTKKRHLGECTGGLWTPPRICGFNFFQNEFCVYDWRQTFGPRL